MEGVHATRACVHTHQQLYLVDMGEGVPSFSVATVGSKTSFYLLLLLYLVSLWPFCYQPLLFANGVLFIDDVAETWSSGSCVLNQRVLKAESLHHLK